MKKHEPLIDRPMLDSNALVLVLDGVASSNLGPYGNTWLETPSWNRLAAVSSLIETAVVDSIELETLYRSFLVGQHALAADQVAASDGLPAQLDARHVESWLVTDDPCVAELAGPSQFSERVILPPPLADQPAATIEETHLAGFFATLLGVLEQANPPFLVWAHAQALRGPWDAPYDLRCRFAEEGDPSPPDFVTPPDCQLAADFDPDELLGFVHANAGQVAVLDFCLGILLDALWSTPLASTTGIVATSSRGFPLGEQMWVGPSDHTLSGNLLQVPWIMHWPTKQPSCERIQQLVQPPDLYATLLEWFDIGNVPDMVWGRSLLQMCGAGQLPGFVCQQAVAVDGDQSLIRVPNWSLRKAADQPPRLFVKPDDRWEVNEVANRCPDIVEQMTALLAQFERAASLGNRNELTALPFDLG